MEVIPKKLAVFSLNTLYFFDNNAAVDGCDKPSEPGYEHMEWLRIQLQFMRERGMKAILMGHVPPARTDSKQLWDESCWQKYTLWLQQYRDVVVGGLYGHMNLDHFMLHDTKDVNLLTGLSSTNEEVRATMEDELDIMSASDYLGELRSDWAGLPNPAIFDNFCSSKVSKDKKKKSKKDRKKKKQLKKIGGPWGERFHVTHVAPSIVPNYFPTLRVMEYNITGLDKSAVWANSKSWSKPATQIALASEAHEVEFTQDEDDYEEMDDIVDGDASIDGKKKKHKKKKKKPKKKPKKPKNPDLHIPSPPTKGTPPGPAYSPQPFTLTGYTQYFANLTHINNDYAPLPDDLDNNSDSDDVVDGEKWREGKHKGKKPKDKPPHPRKFKYEVEYDTFSDKAYKLKDLTVKSYIKLAHRIGKKNSPKGNQIRENLDIDLDEYHADNDESGEKDTNVVDDSDEGEENSLDLIDQSKKKGKKHKKKKKHHKKHHKKHKQNKVWLDFIRRAFVGTLEEDELENFRAAEESSGSGVQQEQTPLADFHDGEL